MKLWLVILAVAVGIVLGIAAFTAQGPPSTPSITSPTSLTPATAQTFTFTMTSNVYSLQPPNSIDLLGTKLIYSVYQNGKEIADNLNVAPSIVGQNGSEFTLAATVQVNLPSICSGSGCVGITDNVTVVAQMQVDTYDTVWFSPVSTVSFGTGQAPSQVQPANPNGFYLELIGPLTGIALMVGIVWVVFKPDLLSFGLTFVSGALLILEFVFWR